MIRLDAYAFQRGTPHFLLSPTTSFRRRIALFSFSLTTLLLLKMLYDFCALGKPRSHSLAIFSATGRRALVLTHHLPFAEQTYRATSTPPPHVLVHQRPSYSSHASSLLFGSDVPGKPTPGTS